VELTLAQLQETGSSGFPGLLGIEFEQAGDGHARARLELEEKHMAPNGYLHAGTVVGFADSACGYAALTLAAPGQDVLAVEFKINLLRPARAARFTARAHVLRAGRTLTVSRADVVGDEEDLVATMLSTVIARPAGAGHISSR